jgi:Fe-S-cluster-containing dehydrogenase component
MSKWNMVIDVAECTNCNLCTLATMDEYVGNDWPGYAAPMPRHGHKWINILKNERGQAPMIDIGYVPTMCNHCDNAPCVAAAKNGEITQRPDGIVLIDPVKSKGKKELVDSCPYGHIWWNDELEIPQAWPFDAHLLDQGWDKTRGHQSCPTAAMQVMKLDDDAMARKVEEENLEVLHPEHGTKPRIFYKNLWRYSSAFIGGTVEATRDGVVDCVEGALVTLTRGGEKIAELESDNYGDFKFDRLDVDSGVYKVTVTKSGHDKRSVDVTLGVSTNIGAIAL